MVDNANLTALVYRAEQLAAQVTAPRSALALGDEKDVVLANYRTIAGLCAQAQAHTLPAGVAPCPMEWKGTDLLEALHIPVEEQSYESDCQGALDCFNRRRVVRAGRCDPGGCTRGYSCMRHDGLAADRRPNYTCWGSQCEK